MNAVGRSGCDSTLCSSTCDYGFRTDARGCSTCECDNPCEHMSCPDGQKCVAGAGSAPTCKAIFVAPCAFGRHLTQASAEDAVHCNVDDPSSCPTGYRCAFSAPNSATFCCPQPEPAANNVTADTKEDDGRLPSICEVMRSQTKRPGYSLAIKNPTCTADVSCKEQEEN